MFLLLFLWCPSLLDSLSRWDLLPCLGVCLFPSLGFWGVYSSLLARCHWCLPPCSPFVWKSLVSGGTTASFGSPVPLAAWSPFGLSLASLGLFLVLVSSFLTGGALLFILVQFGWRFSLLQALPFGVFPRLMASVSNVGSSIALFCVTALRLL